MQFSGLSDPIDFMEARSVKCDVIPARVQLAGWDFPTPRVLTIWIHLLQLVITTTAGPRKSTVHYRLIEYGARIGADMHSRNYKGPTAGEQDQEIAILSAQELQNK